LFTNQHVIYAPDRRFQSLAVLLPNAVPWDHCDLIVWQVGYGHEGSGEDASFNFGHCLFVGFGVERCVSIRLGFGNNASISFWAFLQELLHRNFGLPHALH